MLWGEGEKEMNKDYEMNSVEAVLKGQLLFLSTASIDIWLSAIKNFFFSIVFGNSSTLFKIFKNNFVFEIHTRYCSI